MKKGIFSSSGSLLLIVLVFACASGERNSRGLTVERSSSDTNITIFPQLGHEGIIVAYSPDGRTITSGSKDGTLKLWDAISGREIRSFSGHDEEISAITYSPDSKIIVSGSRDSFITLWDIQTGKEIRTLSGHYGRVSSVAYSSCGKYIASCSRDSTVKIWNTKNGKEIHSLDYDYYPNIVAFSPDGKKVMSVSPTIKILDVVSGKEIIELTNSYAAITAAYSPDGLFIACSYGDDTIKIWDIATNKIIKTFSGHTDNIKFIAYSPDGKIIISASSDKIINFYNTENGNIIRSVTNQSVTSLAYNPNGQTIAVASGSIKLIDVSNGNETLTFTGKSSTGSRVNFHPDGKLILSGSNLWDITTGSEIRRRAGVIFSPDGKITSSDTIGTIKLMDVESGREIKSFQGQSSPDFSTIFSPNGKFIASVSLRNGIKIWDIDNGREIITIIDPSGPPNLMSSIAFSPGGKTIVSGNVNSSVKLWDISSGKEIRTFLGHNSNVTTVAFNPNGKIIASCSWDNTIKLWDVNTGKVINTLTGHLGRMTGGVSSIAFSPDGRTLVSGSVDTTIKLWDVNTGREIKTFKGHLGNVSSVSFSPDGTIIASASKDGTVRLWDVATGKEIAQFISFSGSDSQVATASRGLTVETQTASSTIDGEWLSITPDGYYQASPRGDRYLNVRVNNTVTGIDSYRSVFYNPDVVQARLQGRPDPTSKANVTIQQAASFMPPQVTIRSPSTFTTTNTSATNLSVTVTDQNQPIKNIKIFVNGRAVARNELAAIRGNNLQPERTSLTVTGNQRTVNFELPITLDPGRNLIEVVAFNGYSESARLSPVEVTYNAPAGQQRQLPNLWILAIGVNGYDNAGARLGGMGNLRFAVADAKRLTETLKSQEGRRYAKVNSLIIGDGEAQLPTAENIRRNLSFLDSAGERDIVLLFLAGHGVSAQNGRFFFLPKDAVVTGNSGNWRVDEKLAISGEEITAVLEGQGNRLLFIDACQSGGVDNNRMIRAMMESNAFVFAASQGNELSYEDPRWGGGHGAFTFSILNALRGAPAALAENNVSVRSMSGFVSLEVPRMTQNMQNPRVHSLLFADFPLAVIR